MPRVRSEFSNEAERVCYGRGQRKGIVQGRIYIQLNWLNAPFVQIVKDGMAEVKIVAIEYSTELKIFVPTLQGNRLKSLLP